MRSREKNRRLTDLGHYNTGVGAVEGTGNTWAPKRGPGNPVLRECKKYLKVVGQCHQKVKAGDSGALKAFADLVNVRYLKNILRVVDEEYRELKGLLGLTNVKIAREMLEEHRMKDQEIAELRWELQRTLKRNEKVNEYNRELARGYSVYKKKSEEIMNDHHALHSLLEQELASQNMKRTIQTEINRVTIDFAGAEQRVAQMNQQLAVLVDKVNSVKKNNNLDFHAVKPYLSDIENLRFSEVIASLNKSGVIYQCVSPLYEYIKKLKGTEIQQNRENSRVSTLANQLRNSFVSLQNSQQSLRQDTQIAVTQAQLSLTRLLKRKPPPVPLATFTDSSISCHPKQRTSPSELQVLSNHLEAQYPNQTPLPSVSEIVINILTAQKLQISTLEQAVPCLSLGVHPQVGISVVAPKAIAFKESIEYEIHVISEGLSLSHSLEGSKSFEENQSQSHGSVIEFSHTDEDQILSTISSYSYQRLQRKVKDFKLEIKTLCQDLETKENVNLLTQQLLRQQTKELEELELQLKEASSVDIVHLRSLILALLSRLPPLAKDLETLCASILSILNCGPEAPCSPSTAPSAAPLKKLWSKLTNF